MNIYVGNLPYNVTTRELRLAFRGFGHVEKVALKTDINTGQSKGFAFVEMPDDREARKAIAALNGKEFVDRVLVVNEAQPEPERPPGRRRRR